MRVPLFIILIGLCLRLYLPSNYEFGFDQVQILTNAAAIAGGHLTLIGPRTGPAPMFTGPALYYLTAPFTLLLTPPSVIMVVLLICSLVSALCLLYLGRRYLRDRRQETLLLVVWAISPFLVSLDRTFWNPSLTLPAAALVFFPLIRAIRLRPDRTGLGLIGLGSFLGYQAHFSGLFLPLLAGLVVLVYRLPLKVWVAAILGTTTSLVPTLLFDLRHDWLNLNGFLDLLTHSPVTGEAGYVDRLRHLVFIIVENQGKLLIGYQSSPLVVGIGAGCLLCYLYLVFRRRSTLPLIWLTGIVLGYSFYRGVTPEYYFLVAVPALLFITLELGRSLFSYSRWLFLWVAAALTLTGLWTDVRHARLTGKLSLGDQAAVSRYLYTQSLTGTIKAIEYHMPHAANLGLEYLLRDLPRSTDGVTYTLTFPTTGQTFPRYFGLIGLSEE